MNYPTHRNPSIMEENLYPDSNLVQTLSCPEAPYLFIRLQSLIKLVLPQQLFKAFPGSFLKRWFCTWFLKIIDDYKEISANLNEKIEGYKVAYFNWMENFMEMEYDEIYDFQQENQITASVDSISREDIISNYAARVSHRHRHPEYGIITPPDADLAKARFMFYPGFSKQVLNSSVRKTVNIFYKMFFRPSEKIIQQPQKISTQSLNHLMFPNFTKFVRLE